MSRKDCEIAAEIPHLFLVNHSIHGSGSILFGSTKLIFMSPQTVRVSGFTVAATPTPTNALQKFLRFMLA
jgi:hypothetical protein